MVAQGESAVHSGEVQWNSSGSGDQKADKKGKQEETDAFWA